MTKEEILNDLINKIKIRFDEVPLNVDIDDAMRNIGKCVDRQVNYLKDPKFEICEEISDWIDKALHTIKDDWVGFLWNATVNLINEADLESDYLNNCNIVIEYINETGADICDEDFFDGLYSYINDNNYGFYDEDFLFQNFITKKEVYSKYSEDQLIKLSNWYKNLVLGEIKDYL